MSTKSNIPFRRKLKHLKKNLQRTKDFKPIVEYFAEMGVFVNVYDTIYIFSLLNSNVARTQRIYKWCKRLGKAAKKQNNKVYFKDLISAYSHLYENAKYALYYLKQTYGHEFELKDVRDVPFMTEYKYAHTIIITGTVVACSEEMAKIKIKNKKFYKHSLDEFLKEDSAREAINLERI